MFSSIGNKIGNIVWAIFWWPCFATVYYEYVFCVFVVVLYWISVSGNTERSWISGNRICHGRVVVFLQEKCYISPLLGDHLCCRKTKQAKHWWWCMLRNCQDSVMGNVNNTNEVSWIFIISATAVVLLHFSRFNRAWYGQSISLNFMLYVLGTMTATMCIRSRWELMVEAVSNHPCQQLTSASGHTLAQKLLLWQRIIQHKIAGRARYSLQLLYRVRFPLELGYSIGCKVVDNGSSPTYFLRCGLKY